jgi:cytochrome c553
MFYMGTRRSKVAIDIICRMKNGVVTFSAVVGAALAAAVVISRQGTPPEATFPADPLPTWAYPVPNPADAAFVRQDLDVPQHVPDSSRTYTLRQIDDNFNPPDWHPEDHPAAPAPVFRGKLPDARACGVCHLPIGTGHPESGYIAGLPKEYMFEQIVAFRNGNRKSSVALRSENMIALARQWSDEEIKAAIDYFAALPRRRWVRVVESSTVPKTILPSQMRFAKPGGETEPLGRRIIEFAETRDRSEARDTRRGAGFVAYVPVGSISRGQDLVMTGGARIVDGKIVLGKTMPCGQCHGPDLKGQTNAPPLVGVHPVYVVRQLYDMQHHTRVGPIVALMQPVIANLTIDDMINIAAYLGSLNPGGPDLRPLIAPAGNTSAE